MVSFAWHSQHIYSLKLAFITSYAPPILGGGMLIEHDIKTQLCEFSQKLGLVTPQRNNKSNKIRKVEQIIAFLEVIHSQVRKYSHKRELVFVDSGAGNCYLSFIVYYYYHYVVQRPVRIHCIDINEALMNKNRDFAESIGFVQMHFHTADIEQYTHNGPIDVAYSLHACDIATDKAMLLGLRNNAKHILSVSCCQHSVKGKMQSYVSTRGLTKHSVIKDRLLYMVLDSMRALLLEMRSYDVDVIEFVSTRATDKNLMIRAHKKQLVNADAIFGQYKHLRSAYNLRPYLEGKLVELGLVSSFDQTSN
ncbi:methyltransferase [Vibrio sp. 99-8-1]|nr:methyltransferase [Vibrio sp. 99-8-1]